MIGKILPLAEIISRIKNILNFNQSCEYFNNDIYSWLTIPSWGTSFEDINESDEYSDDENNESSSQNADNSEGESSESSESVSQSMEREEPTNQKANNKQEDTDDPHLQGLFEMFPSADRDMVKNMYMVNGQNAEVTSLFLLEQGAGGADDFGAAPVQVAVSYTHLTLPTICSV